MAISNLDVKNNEVVFTFKNDFIKDNVVTLTNRYCFVL